MKAGIAGLVGFVVLVMVALPLGLSVAGGGLAAALLSQSSSLCLPDEIGAVPTGAGQAETDQIARTAIAVGKAHGIPERGWVVIIAAGMIESGGGKPELHNLDYGHLDSAGWLQQRPSAGWGTVAQIRDPKLAAEAFYGVAKHTNNRGLVDVFDWEHKSIGDAAQAVQVSRSNAYHNREADARALVAKVSGTVPAADDSSCAGETSNGDMGGAIKLVAELNPDGSGNWQGAVKAGGYWFVAHARRGDRVAIFHRLNAAGREVDQMTVTGGQMHPTGFAVIGNTIYADYGTSVVTFAYRPGARIGKSGTTPTGWQGEISAAPDGRTAVLRQGNRYRLIVLASGIQTGLTVRTPPGARQGFSVLGDVLYVLTGASNKPARVDTYSFKTGRQISTRSVTGVGFKPGENRSFREPEGMWGNMMGVKVKNGNARRLRVYSIADGFSSSGKTRRVTSQGKSYSIPIPAGRAGKAINFALDQLGDRYVWAAHGPDAWDCSGLTGGAWIHAGIRIPQQSDAQRASLRQVPTSQMRPGDILWHPGHVQLYLGLVAGKRTVVEAANPRVPVRIDQTGWMDIQAVLRP